MKLLKSAHFLFPISKIKFFSTLFIFTGILCLHGEKFEECLPERYHFTCADPYAFLLSMGIDVEQDIIPYYDLHLHGEKIDGHSYGGIFRGSSTTYYVKECKRILNEVAGSKLMHLIAGKLHTPEVKVVRTAKKEIIQSVASEKLSRFRMHKKCKTSNKIIIGEVELAVAMDFLGLVDRHSKNMGYIRLNSHSLLAARVDLDSCFDFETTALHRYNKNTNHLSLHHIYESLKKFPKDQVMDNMRKIVAIPDEKIIITLLQSWVTLSRVGSTLELEDCLDIARKLIERKDAFRVALEDPHFLAYHPPKPIFAAPAKPKKQARAHKQIVKRETSINKKDEKKRIAFERQAAREKKKKLLASKKHSKTHQKHTLSK